MTMLFTDVAGSARRYYRIPDSGVITVEPSIEPVEVSEFKAHANIDGTDADDVHEGLVLAARKTIEDQLGRAMINQTWQFRWEEFPADDSPLVIPRAPLVSVSSITYVDTAGVTQTMSASEYQVDSKRTPGVIYPAYGTSWPSVRDSTINAVIVTAVCGYGATAASVPQTLRLAIKQLATHWHEQREPVQMFVGGTMGVVPKHMFWMIDMYRVRFW